MPLLLQIVLAGCLASSISVSVGALITFGLPRLWLSRLVSFSTGILLATALLNLLPEALESHLPPQFLLAVVLAGILLFFSLEKLAVWRHAHGAEPDNHSASQHAHPPRPDATLSKAAPMIILGDGFHNFTDGILLSAAFISSPALGWAMALAIIAHAIPQEAGDLVLLLEAGWERRRAYFWNLASTSMAVPGGLLGYLALDQLQDMVPAGLALAAASFIYIAVSDLMPWLRRERSMAYWHFAFMTLGVALVSALLWLRHGASGF